MIISHKHKYLFVEVPSTASTAISHELRKYYDGELFLWKHANYSEFKRAATAIEREYFTFATVRNPLDKAVSHYIRLKKNHDGVYTDSKKFARDGGWVPDDHLEKFDFIHDVDADFGTFFKRFYGTIFNEWVLMCHAQLDYVMRYESIQDEFAKVLKLIGIEQVQPIQARNTTGRDTHFTEYYTPDLYETAARNLGPFMRKWGYDFPEGWPAQKVPLSRRVTFNTVDKAVNFVGKFAAIDQRTSRLQKVKTLLRNLRWA